jgi:hypothetical protein
VYGGVAQWGHSRDSGTGVEGNLPSERHFYAIEREMR